MLDNIGHVAGAIWHYLEENNEATVTKITREIGETERSVLMGVGWLAREGKLNFKPTQTRHLHHTQNTTIRRRCWIDFGRSTELNETTPSINSGPDLTVES